MSIIDIHAHYVSPELIAEARKNVDRYGVRVVDERENVTRLILAGTPPLRPFFDELCDLRMRIPLLDAQGIDVQVISTWTDLSGDELPAKQGVRWARLQNETLAAAAAEIPQRFRAMGTLPMQTPADTLTEIDYLVERLGVFAVEIGTNINGVELDHPELRPVWRRIAETKLLVLLHPARIPAGIERGREYFLNNLVLYPTDTTLAAARLIFSGIMQEFPSLRICLAHGGGFLPYQAGRLDRGYEAHPDCSKKLNEAPSAFLRTFYYDTLTHADLALDYLLETVGPHQVLFGSDYPFEMVDASWLKRIKSLELEEGSESAILGGNAVRMLGLNRRTLAHLTSD